METSLGNLAHITYSFKHDQNKLMGFKISYFHLTQNNGQQMMTKMIIHMCPHCCSIMHFLHVINIMQEVLRSPFVIIFIKSNPLFRPYRHFEQETRLIKFCLGN
jgi:hypothetical protein